MIDIGGGSTELVVGARGEVDFHVSTQIGVVRHTERHLHADPPTARGARRAARATCARASSRPGRTAPTAARSPSPARRPSARRSTSELEPYDPARVEGHVLTAEPPARAAATGLAALPLAERARDPGPAPRPRAGDRRRDRRSCSKCWRRFGLDRVEVSERDILWGLALSTAARPDVKVRMSAHGHLFDCSRRSLQGGESRLVGRAVVPPAAVHRHIGPGDAASSAPPAAWTTQ